MSNNKSDNKIERIIEQGLFLSRWLMAPFYIGLSLSLAVLLYTFCRELMHITLSIKDTNSNDIILWILNLIDLSLCGNLILIVVFAGYENFVSKIDVGDHKDDFEWRGSIDFFSLKLKLVSSIVAISGIHLLGVFMKMNKNASSLEVKWSVIIHVVFIFSGLFLAAMDFIAVNTSKMKDIESKNDNCP